MPNISIAHFECVDLQEHEMSVGDIRDTLKKQIESKKAHVLYNGIEKHFLGKDSNGTLQIYYSIEGRTTYRTFTEVYLAGRKDLFSCMTQKKFYDPLHTTGMEKTLHTDMGNLIFEVCCKGDIETMKWVLSEGGALPLETLYPVFDCGHTDLATFLYNRFPRLVIPWRNYDIYDKNVQGWMDTRRRRTTVEETS